MPEHTKHQENDPTKEPSKAEVLIEFTRDYHLSKANEIDLNKVPAERLTAAYYEKDRLQYVAAVLQEILKKIQE